MAFKLQDLFPAGELIGARGGLDRPISGLTMDSRRVVPGNLFFALPGLRTDGAGYIDEAITRGAVAVVTQKPVALPHGRVTFLQVADARDALARVAQRYFKFPDRDLEIVGVTGTNGKTTVTHLLKHLLDGGHRVGLIGTVNYDLGARTVPSYKTTPESLDLYAMLAQMRDAGCRQAVMEVSSHGIDQKRILGMRFDAMVFTNLTRDHLDYHKSMEAYFRTKARLFTGEIQPPPALAVINLDDPYGRRLLDLLPTEMRRVTFGEHAAADLRAEDLRLESKRTTFRLVWSGGAAEVGSALIGRYNVSNLLAALAAAHALGHELPPLVSRLGSFGNVAGRMERIEEGQPFNVLVDYAHTDDALRNALDMLRAVTPGRLLVVFGCGGNRDRTKRPLMVRAVQERADYAWATADNPRSEGLERIFADMREGVTAPDRIAFVEDRRRAMSLALDAARSGDCLLIAGKGHESYQELTDTVIPFDDRQVVRELIGVKRIKEG